MRADKLGRYFRRIGENAGADDVLLHDTSSCNARGYRKARCTPIIGVQRGAVRYFKHKRYYAKLNTIAKGKQGNAP